ncbi:MAG: hypothetical protein ACREAA_04715 [Candidatus Polarisedimenticolia bacterium]
MSWKRISMSAFLVLVTKAVVGAIFFGLVFTDVHEGAGTAFRAEGTENHGIAMVGYVAWSLAFSFVFARGFENRGWLEGVRFGLIVWLLYFVPMTLGIYGYFVVGPEWMLSALISGLAEALACGSVAALVFRNAPMKTAAAG